MRKRIHSNTVAVGATLLGMTALLLANAETKGNHSPVGPQLVNDFGNLPLSFEANEGQSESNVRFLSRGDGYTFYLTQNAEAVLALPTRAHRSATPKRPGERAALSNSPEDTTTQVLRLELAGAEKSPYFQGIGKLDGVVNYFVGSDPSKWQKKLPTYEKVMVHNIYPGIDEVYYGNQRDLEQDFIVSPGITVDTIKMIVEGAEKLSLDDQGDLIVSLKEGQTRLHRPVAYQVIQGKRREIASNFVVRDGHEIGFKVAAYDKKQPLIVDPVLTYSTNLGGNDSDRAYKVRQDSEGNIYVCGETNSRNFPITGAFQTIPLAPGASAAFVTKLNSSASTIIYSTYLGGFGNSAASGLAIDSAGNAFVGGTTLDTFFPTTQGALQSSAFGVGNARGFVTKLDPAGSILFSTYIGTNDGRDTDLQDLALGPGDAVHLAGWTTSAAFPVTSDAYQPTLSEAALPGSSDLFVSQLDSSGSTLLHSTYLGGAGDSEFLSALAVDSNGDDYIVGSLHLNIFPVTPGAFQTACTQYGLCGFVAKLNNTDSTLVYSSYLAGDGPTWATGIAVDSDGNAYISGTTGATNFPTTPGAYQTVQTSPDYDSFVIKLNPLGTASVYSTYLGGHNADFGGPIAVDAAGNAYVADYSTSVDFPTINALQTATAKYPHYFAYVATLNPAGSGLIFSSSISGTGDDSPYGISLDASANVYVVGATTSPDFPVTPGAVQPVPGSAAPLTDGFLFKISGITASSMPTVTNVTPGSATDGSQVVITGINFGAMPSAVGFTIGGSSLQGTISGGSDTSISVTVPHLPAGSGSFIVTASNGLISNPIPFTILPTSQAITFGAAPTLAVGGSGTIISTASSGLPVSLSSATQATCSVAGNVAMALAIGSCTVNAIQAGNAYYAPASPATLTFPISGLPSLSPSMLNFGNQPVATTSAIQTVTLNNASGAGITVGVISISGSFTQPGGTCASTLAASGSCTINVSFAPKATGVIAGTLTIGTIGTVALSGTGVVVRANLTPTTFSFGSQQVGTTSAAESFTYTNTGTVPIVVSGIAFGRTGAPNFGIANDGCTGVSLAPSASCEIIVNFTPTAARSQAATLTMTDTTGGAPAQRANLTGLGIAPSVSFGARSYSYGAVLVPTAATFTLTNSGTAPFAISSIALSTGTEFRATGGTCTPGSTIGNGTSCTITVLFTPSGTAVFGDVLRVSGTGVGAGAPTYTASSTLRGR